MLFLCSTAAGDYKGVKGVVTRGGGGPFAVTYLQIFYETTLATANMAPPMIDVDGEGSRAVYYCDLHVYVDCFVVVA